MHEAQISTGRAKWTFILCGLLLIAFAVNSYSAVLTKNATIDEPTHAIAGWMALRQGDFAVETVNPPLWKCWAAIGNFFSHPAVSHAGIVFSPAGDVTWSSKVLFGTPGFNGEAFVNRARAMMLAIGVLLGGVIAWWSYQLAGPVASTVATALYCFDPNFIAHSAMVKSDVAFSLVFLLLAFAIWKLGQRATLARLLLVGLFCGLALNLKFSGVIAGPVLAAMLLARVVMPISWDFFGRSLRTKRGRFIAAAGTGIFGAACCFGLIWACFGFRYWPKDKIDMQVIYDRAAVVETTARLMRTPTAGEVQSHVPGAVCQFVKWADARQLLPQAMLAGFLYQHTCVELWPAFLNGELYGDGRWSYFPLAILYKTPIAELIAIGLAMGVMAKAISRLRDRPDLQWTVICLFIPFAIFAAAAITAHLNIGLRNVLPLYPFLQITAGCAAAMAWRYSLRSTGAVVSVLAIALAIETLTAWPDYIAFFNFASGGKEAGISHLADSNLDWGQDIKSLAQWQQHHPDLPMYAKLYYGVDPEYYGLKYQPLVINPTTGRLIFPINSGVVAVSATQLQGLYLKPFEIPFYQRLRSLRPAAILGGTVYLYPATSVN